MAPFLPFKVVVSFHDPLSRLLRQPPILAVTGWTVHVLPGPVLHRAAFTAAERGDARAADRLYDRAALAYQIEGDAEGSASLRTHRLLRTLGTAADPGVRDSLAGEIAARIMRATPAGMLEPPLDFAGEDPAGDELPGERRAA